MSHTNILPSSDRNQNHLSTSCGILKSQNHVCPEAVPEEKDTQGKFFAELFVQVVINFTQHSSNGIELN